MVNVTPKAARSESLPTFKTNDDIPRRQDATTQDH